MVLISAYSSAPCWPSPPTPNATADDTQAAVEAAVPGTVFAQEIGLVALGQGCGLGAGRSRGGPRSVWCGASSELTTALTPGSQKLCR